MPSVYKSEHLSVFYCQGASQTSRKVELTITDYPTSYYYLLHLYVAFRIIIVVILGKVLIARTARNGVCVYPFMAALTCVRNSFSLLCFWYLVMKAPLPYYADEENSV